MAGVSRDPWSPNAIVDAGESLLRRGPRSTFTLDSVDFDLSIEIFDSFYEHRFKI